MKLKLVKKQDEAKGTKSFFWEPEKPVTYLPGQFLYYTLPKLNYPDPRGETRHFTISSSPTEGPTLRLTTRIREESGYKKTLDELQIGAEIEGEGPNGTFVLNDDDLGPHVFLAGGIGITPFRSMFKYALDKNLPTQIYLIYSDSTEEDMAFKKELGEAAKTRPNIKIELVITSKIGRIDELLIKKLIGNWKLEIKNCIWWVSGPPAFVDAMQEILGKVGVTSNHLRAEKFTGY